MRQQTIGGFKRGRANNKAIVLLGAVGAMGLLTVVLSLLFSGAAPTPASVIVQQEKPESTVNVLIPVRQIETGEVLDPTLFRVERRPQSSVPASVAGDFEQIRGMYARNTITIEQPVHLDLITSIRPTNAITANIPEGFRAVTIRVDATTSVEGWARAGANVDVVWASTVRGRQAVTTIVQNAKVLSAERQVDANLQPGMPVPSTVTLLVTADDAAKIQLASTTGSLSLSLRGDDDQGKGGASGSITVDDLLGNSDGGGSAPIANEGRIKIGGEEYYLQDGKLVPK